MIEMLEEKIANYKEAIILGKDGEDEFKSVAVSCTLVLTKAHTGESLEKLSSLQEKAEKFKNFENLTNPNKQ